MKFFTTNLYLLYNSNDPEELDRADRQWEQALQRYRKHLAEIGPQLPAGARSLAESFDLHDADYLGLSLFSEVEGSLAMLRLRDGDTLIRLDYYLTEEPLIEPAKEPWDFSAERVHWLYDEFDTTPDGAHQHEILLSNGRTLTLKFHDVHITQKRLPSG